MEKAKQNQTNGGSQKVGNVSVQIGSEKGYYVGSASNMTRLFIFCNILWAFVLGLACYFGGVQIGNLEHRVEFLERLHK